MKELFSKEELEKIDRYYSDEATEEDDTGMCELCEAHQRAKEIIPNGIPCPHCGHNHKSLSFSGLTVVGVSNVYDGEDRINKYLTTRCQECDGHFALFPEKIMYNANHNVYYTGEGHFLHDSDSRVFTELKREVEKLTENYYQRRLSGESLEPMNISTWIDYAVQGAIAKYLFEKGIKS